MARYILRVWLPDKPGALGRVAGAIGSVGASMIGIDILEQDGGYAIDELIVESVASPNSVEKLVAALQFVEGVNVEDIRESPGEMVDARVDALDTAAELVEQAKVPALIEVLVRRARHDMNATWAVFIAHNDVEPRMSTGDVPASAWIKAFIAGSKSSQELGLVNTGPDDIAWTELLHAEAALVLGRDKRPFRARERQQLAALARIADRRLRELPE